MAETKGRPSATVPDTRQTERTTSGRIVERVSPIQQQAGGRVQEVPGWSEKAATGGQQTVPDANLRSGSGVPSEDEVAQLYGNGKTAPDVRSLLSLAGIHVTEVSAGASCSYMLLHLFLQYFTQAIYMQQSANWLKAWHHPMLAFTACVCVATRGLIDDCCMLACR